MSDDTLLWVEGVSKKFSRDLKASLRYGIAAIWDELRAHHNPTPTLRPSEFWALHDVSFTLRRGESSGLIGRNGVGKSTLLKLINGLFKPDAGRIRVRGRVGALIELGAGFSPVLTGRENITINAAVLGIPQREVDLEAIVDFAELDDFIDAPVQSYSSGMKVRLGFAIAAQLQPDILLVDEVLAVGDLAFRTKCLRRLNELRQQGVAFILVSHNLTHILQFTERALWLEGGAVAMDGPPLAVCSAYQAGAVDAPLNPYGELLDDHLDLAEAHVTLNGAVEAELQMGQYATIEFAFTTRRDLLHPTVSFPIYYEDGTHITAIASVGRGIELKHKEGRYAGRVRFGPVNFNPGNYVLLANLHDGAEHLSRYVAARFRVVSPDARLTWGVVDLDQEWVLE